MLKRGKSQDMFEKADSSLRLGASDVPVKEEYWAEEQIVRAVRRLNDDSISLSRLTMKQLLTRQALARLDRVGQKPCSVETEFNSNAVT